MSSVVCGGVTNPAGASLVSWWRALVAMQTDPEKEPQAVQDV